MNIKNKKIISFVLCALSLSITLALAGCDGSETDDTPGPDTAARADLTTGEADTEGEGNDGGNAPAQTGDEASDAPEAPEVAETSGMSETVDAPETNPVNGSDGGSAGGQSSACTHASTVTVNAVDATCGADGYTGDSRCGSCGKTLAYGKTIARTGAHGTLVRSGAREATHTAEGYTGDEVCSVCGTVVNAGTVIPKLANDTIYYTYTNGAGQTITLPAGVNVLDYTLDQANKSASSSFSAVEAEILRLINIERTNAGLAPLTNEPRAYFFAKKRTEECFSSFSHTRPDGRSWETVYDDYGVFFVYSAENLAGGKGIPTDSIAVAALDGWMGSPGHRANILSPTYTSTSISVIYDPATQVHYVTQHFFGD